MTEATIGHNSGGPDGTAKEELKSIVSRIEELEEQKQSISEDISGIYKEAKSLQFDVKTIRSIIKLRKLNSVEREAAEERLATYMSALGMLSDTPLGEAALRRVAA